MLCACGLAKVDVCLHPPMPHRSIFHGIEVAGEVTGVVLAQNLGAHEPLNAADVDLVAELETERIANELGDVVDSERYGPLVLVID